MYALRKTYFNNFQRPIFKQFLIAVFFLSEIVYRNVGATFQFGRITFATDNSFKKVICCNKYSINLAEV